MKEILGWFSLAFGAWSLITYFVGITDQAIYFILLSIYLLFLSQAAVR